MNEVIYMLFAFVAIGLFADRLGRKWSTILLVVAIAVYVTYAFRH